MTAKDMAERYHEGEPIRENADNAPRYTPKSNGKETPAKIGTGIIATLASQVVIKPIEWVWPSRLARGKLCCIAGDPGAGKSHIVVAMTAAITRGRKWPCDEGTAPLGNVIILSAEDAAEDTIVPRLIAAGADLNRIKIIEMVKVDEADGGRRFDLAADIGRLEAEIKNTGDVQLVSIDPISAYLGGGIDGWKNAQVRGVLEPLSKMSERARVATLAVTHFNKAKSQSGKNKAIYRFIDSIAFVAAARTAFVATEDPEALDRKFLLHAKNNIAKPPQGLTYTIDTAVAYDCNDRPIGTSRLEWGEEPVDRQADEAVASDTPDRGHALREAEDFLKEMLKGDVEVPCSKIQKEAKKAGVAWGTLRRAKNRLNVTVKKQQVADGEWVWSLSTTDRNRRCSNDP
jgi:hypothetical protein